MRAKKWLIAAVSTVALVCVATGSLVGGSVAAAAATGPSGGTWAAPVPFPGFPGFDGTNSTLTTIDCPAPGDCTAVGSTNDPVVAPIAASEVNGAWQGVQAISFPASLGSFRTFTHLSCDPGGGCTAVGWYIGSAGVATAFYMSETGGVWGTPQAVTGGNQPSGTVSTANGVSCPAAGYCTVVGEFVDEAQNGASIRVPFTLDEANSSWGTAQAVPGLSSVTAGGVYASLDSVACAAPGDCTAVGESGGAESGDNYPGSPFVVSESGGSWSAAKSLPPGWAARAVKIACPDAMDCTVAGYASPGWTYVYDETNGQWDDGQKLGFNTPPLLGCSSAGHCVIAAGTSNEPFIATESTSGSWSTGAVPPGFSASSETGSAETVSCVPGGDCTIAGTAEPDGVLDFSVWTVTSAPDGTVGSLRPDYDSSVGLAYVYGLSCPQDGYCTLALGLDDAIQLGAEATASTVSLTASAATVAYGAEQSETLTATAAPVAGIEPTGTVTVAGPSGATLCTITLADGTGSCPLPANQLTAGPSTLTATYNGDATFLPSTDSASVTVTQAATATRLAVTPAAITFSGTASKLAISGTVSSPGATPTGTAAVHVDGHTVTGCTSVPLNGGKITCTGTTAILAGGKHAVTLSYVGAANFTASTSAVVTVTVGVAGSTPALALSRSSVTYGHENVEKFTVSVSRKGSVYPTGKAQVRMGSTTLCTVTLTSNGTGSCTLAARQLRAGTYSITAVYLGNADYHSSQSARKALKVVR